MADCTAVYSANSAYKKRLIGRNRYTSAYRDEGLLKFGKIASVVSSAESGMYDYCHIFLWTVFAVSLNSGLIGFFKAIPQKKLNSFFIEAIFFRSGKIFNSRLRRLCRAFHLSISLCIRR